MNWLHIPPLQNLMDVLQPENLLSAGEGEGEVVKVADFGFAKNFGEEKLVTSCGSPGYVGTHIRRVPRFHDNPFVLHLLFV
jgi:hypothetical protein